MNEYVKEHGFAGWFETSAKENVHIEEAARALVNKVSDEVDAYIFMVSYTYSITIPDIT